MKRLLATLFLIALPILAQDDEKPLLGKVRARRSTQLRAQPSNAGAVLRKLPADAVISWVQGQKRGEFLRVMVPKGPQGWVRAADIEVQAEPPADSFTEAAKPPCFATLDACPAIGCGISGTDQAIFNAAKRRTPAAGSPTPVDFGDFSLLQEQADPLAGQGESLSQPERDSLSDLTVSAGTVGEGSRVLITGFIAQGALPHANSGGESVNCRLKTAKNNDFHISIVEVPADDEFAGIVVEMIPQDRPAGWTLTKLKKVRTQKRRVLVEGGLFYDNIHLVNADPDNPLSGQPKRFSVWEIHPVTGFFVCLKAGNSCDASNLSDWKPLADFQ